MMRVLLIFLISNLNAFAADSTRPNILWLVNDDHGVQIGAYGDLQAKTPNFDALASKGMRYSRCWANAPDIAPALTTLLWGIHANSSGGEHSRSSVLPPKGKQPYPQILRTNGYFCTNNAKEDSNIWSPSRVWDISSASAHWKYRPEGKPFMAVFYSDKSAKGRIRADSRTIVRSPAAMRIPAYHPDTPEVREDWARYYELVTAADADAGDRLKELALAGLAEDTIVFYYAGSGTGMPGCAGCPYNRGLQVPLVVYIPEKFKDLRPPEYQPGGVSERLVSFVDFAPTVCSIAGIPPPGWMQGQAFLGKFTSPPVTHLYGYRGRIDDRIDCIRSVTDGRHVYVRNFRPDLAYGQHPDFRWQPATLGIWSKMHAEGKLNDSQGAFWKAKVPEELYDLETDPDEVRNLVTSPDHGEILEKLRAALDENKNRIIDVGLLPEWEMGRVAAGSPYDFARNKEVFHFGRIKATAELASSLDPEAVPALVAALGDVDSGVRYWGVMGLYMRGAGTVRETRDALLKLLDDSSPEVRISAAEALGRYGAESDLSRVLELLGRMSDFKSAGDHATISALSTLRVLGEKAAPLRPTLKALPSAEGVSISRAKPYIVRLLEEVRN